MTIVLRARIEVQHVQIIEASVGDRGMMRCAKQANGLLLTLSSEH